MRGETRIGAIGNHWIRGTRLVDKMIALHGDLGNPYRLWTAAQGVFEREQGASS